MALGSLCRTASCLSCKASGSQAVTRFGSQHSSAQCESARGAPQTMNPPTRQDSDLDIKKFSGGVWVPLLHAALRGLGLVAPRSVRVMTDCSGLEALILGMEAAGVQIQHLASCDIDKNVRSWIQSRHRPHILFEDMLNRDLSTLSGADLDLYVCGFPCTPFSARRTNTTRLFDEPAAKVFYATIQTLTQLKPRMFVLENVRGILRPACLEEVNRNLNRIASLGYTITWVLPSDSAPSRFGGYPIRRPRVFIVGCLSDSEAGAAWEQRFHACLKLMADASVSGVDFVSFLSDRGFDMTPRSTDTLSCSCTLEKSCSRPAICAMMQFTISATDPFQACKW